MPSCFVRIVTGAGLLAGAHERDEGNTHHPAARVTLGRSEGPAFQIDRFGDPCLLCELAASGLCRTLPLIDEPSWQSQLALEWITTALDQKNLQMAIGKAHRRDIGGECGAGVLVRHISEPTSNGDSTEASVLRNRAFATLLMEKVCIEPMKSAMIPIMKWVFYSVILSAIVLGCAEGMERPGQRITPRPNMDQGVPPDRRTLSDSEVLDARTPSADATLGTARSVWVIVGDESFEAGPRSTLSPPQVPVLPAQSDVLEALPDVTPVVIWRGPETPSDQLAKVLLAEGRRVVPLLVLPSDSAGVDLEVQFRLELRYLEAQLLRPQAERAEMETPLLAVRWREGFPLSINQVTTAIAELGSQPSLIILDAPETGFAATSVDVVLVPPCHREASPLRTSVSQITCISPPSLPTNTDLFSWMLIEGRRTIDVFGGTLLLDGIARWRDDRQLDPILTQDAIMSTSDGVTIMVPSYGDARLLAAERLTRPAVEGVRLSEVVGEPYLIGSGLSLSIHRDDDGQIHLDGRVTEDNVRGAILNRNPWFVAPNMALTYRRNRAVVYLRVVDDRGRVSAPPAADVLDVCVPLSEDTATRIEELELIWADEGGDEAFSVTDVRLVAGDGPQCQQVLDRDDLPP